MQFWMCSSSDSMALSLLFADQWRAKNFQPHYSKAAAFSAVRSRAINGVFASHHWQNCPDFIHTVHIERLHVACKNKNSTTLEIFIWNREITYTINYTASEMYREMTIRNLEIDNTNQVVRHVPLWFIRIANVLSTRTLSRSAWFPGKRAFSFLLLVRNRSERADAVFWWFTRHTFA